MALEFTHFAKGLVLQKFFGGSSSLGGRADESLQGNLIIQFYSGTRPNLNNLTEAQMNWATSQGGLGQSLTGFSGATKLYPNSTTFTALNDGGMLVKTSSAAGGVTADWTNNKVTSSAESLGSGLFFGAGNLSWFACYMGSGSGYNSGLGWKLAFTGSVGVTGSGADIEVNRVDIPDSTYPINVKRLSFKFPQPSNVDLIFNKGIYMTALLNIFGFGYGYSSTDSLVKTVYNGVINNDAVQSPNIIQLYSGNRPSSPNDAVPAGNTLIATVNTYLGMTNPTQGTYSGWGLTSTTTTSEVSVSLTQNMVGTVLATGNPTWCRILSNSKNDATTYAAIDCSAGATGSGSAVIYNESPVAGQQINISSIKFSMA